MDLGLVGNESDQPTEHGSALRICYKKAITPDCGTQQVPSGYILLALLVQEVSKRDYTTLSTWKDVCVPHSTGSVRSRFFVFRVLLPKVYLSTGGDEGMILFL